MLKFNLISLQFICIRSSRLDELNSELDKFKKLEILDHKPDLDPGHSVEEAEDALEVTIH